MIVYNYNSDSKQYDISYYYNNANNNTFKIILSKIIAKSDKLINEISNYIENLLNNFEFNETYEYDVLTINEDLRIIKITCRKP